MWEIMMWVGGNKAGKSRLGQFVVFKFSFVDQ